MHLSALWVNLIRTHQSWLLWRAIGNNPLSFSNRTEAHKIMSQGSAGNVIAALASFFVPGLGQLVQGRILAALVHFIVTGLLWLVWLGWVGHIFSCIDAARWKAP